MKKYHYILAVILFCIIGASGRQAEAYSVTVKTDGIYADVIPDAFVNQTADLFKKHVKKAMKYYNKYKDAGEYTYVKNVPGEYRDFIPVAKQIQDSDKIIIRNPFYIYFPGDDAEICEDIYFFAERNGKKLCMFSISIDWDMEKVSLLYNKIESSQFIYEYDKDIIGKTLFYEMDGITYAETPDKVRTLRNRQSSDGEKMANADGNDYVNEQKAIDRKFEAKSYDEKKKEILDYVGNMKTGKIKTVPKKQKKVVKNSQNVTSDFEDDSVELDNNTQENSKNGNYIMIGIGVLVIAVFAGGIILLIKRKRG